MTYWTLMVITVLNGSMENGQMYVLYETEQSCIDAIVPVTQTLTYDYKVECMVSDTLSDSIRPEPRP